ncbi:MAG: hypothetical protein V4524_03490 [Patescibacteria group bacterium]
MRTLLAVIVAVLNGEENIPELPNDQLQAFQNQGQPIPGSVNGEVFHKIARLQTLIFREQEKAGIPDMEVLKQMCAESHQDFATVMARSLSVQEDATANIMMLERLIVGVVREACPRECDRFGVRYYADISLRIFFGESPQRRFLD